MKTQPLPQTPAQPLRIVSPPARFLVARLLACLIALCLTALSANAAAGTLTWDASGNGTALDGTGNWTGGNNWWTGTGDIAWTNGAGVNFGTNTPGTYTVTLLSPITVATLNFKTNNYTLTGASVLTHTNGLTVAAGVTATINCPVSTPGAGYSIGNNGASLTLGGGLASTTGNPNFNGSTLATSTLNITNGSFTAAGTETYNNITVNQSGGAVAYAIWNIGRTAPATYNLSGGTLRNTTVNAWSISRGFTAIVNISNTGLLGAFGNVGIASTTATDNGTLNVAGGTANIGTGISGTPGVTSASLGNINMLALGSAGTYSAASKAVLNISGGVTTAKGIVFGSSVSSYVSNPPCIFNLSGGALYLDANGITMGSGVSGLNTVAVTLSGGLLAATANWTASVPVSLTNINGNLNAQAADTNGTSFNITLAGPVSGQGGLLKTGGGNLTLSGGATYSGLTTVSNGQFTVTTAGATAIGAVIMESSTTLSTVMTAAAKSWTNAGLSFSNSTALDFNFGGFQLSPSSRVIQINGDLTLDSSSTVTIEGSAILVGTYPLMTCTGTLTLAGGVSLPTIISLPGGVAATLAQSGKTINLVVTSSPNNPLNWGTSASGPWDFTTTDWVVAGGGGPTNYSDGVAVTFNDNTQTAVAIDLRSNVQPVSVTANNTLGGTTAYTITGAGSIGGGTSVLLQGSGLFALGTTNTYSGGTIVNSGTLGINYGGDGSGPSGIGTGPLTLNTGAALDNTSGSNVVLNTPLQEYWNGDFTYAGSQTNLDLGIGPVSLGNNLVLTVLSNRLTCGGVITDNGANYKLTVQGPGTLTLSGLNTYAGGTTLTSGKLNINNGGDGGADSAIGTGTFTINGGTIDNTSGADLQLLQSIPEAWNANFTFAGTTNLDLGAGNLAVQTITATLQNGATLRTEGGMTAVGSGAVATMTLAGNGTFQTSANKNNPGLSVVVGSGVTYLMDKSSSASIHSVGGTLVVVTNGLARVTGTGGRQVVSTTSGTVTLNGGTLDLNGNTETMFLINFNAGVLQNSNLNPAGLAMVTNVNLRGASCRFDVVTNSSLNIPSSVIGNGSLVMIGEGTLNLGGTNSYIGSTTVSNGLVTFTTATLANRNYTVANGELEAILDPQGVQLQMSMSNLTFAAGTRVGFDLASGAFGDTTNSLIAARNVIMNGSVAVDVFNAPPTSNDSVLLSYTNRTGAGLFVAGTIPVGSYIYDNTANHTVVLTYTAPPPPSPSITTVGSVSTGGIVTGITLSGVHGPPNGTFELMSSTNVSLSPLTLWTPVQSGNFDASGNFNITNAVSITTPQLYFLLRVP